MRRSLTNFIRLSDISVELHFWSGKVIKMEKNHHYHLKLLRNSLHKIYRSKVWFGVELIVSGLFGIFVFFPVLAILLGLNELLRQTVRLGLWLVYGDGVQLSPDHIGSNYKMITPRSRRHTILYLGEFEQPLDVQKTRDQFQKHVVENEIYSKCKCVWEERWGYVCLKRCEDFNIANHIRAYPGSEGRVVGEKELLEEILPELSQDMEGGDKPQWEILIIPSYQQSSSEAEADTQFTPKKALKVIRIHHSYMDGASTLIMIANTFSGEGKAFPYVIDPCKPLKISKWAMFVYKLMSLALFSSSSIKNLVMPPMLRYSRFSLRNSPKPGKLLFSYTGKIPMSSFKGIKEKSGVSMPAIVSAAISGAMRNMEVRHPDKRTTKESTKQPLWLVAGMFRYSKDKPGNNHIGLETIVDISDMSGTQRLTLMNDELGRLAKNPLVYVYFWYTQIIGRCPTWVSNVFLRMAVCPILLSNIPLCTRNIKMWGKECTDIMGWVPLISNTGLGIVSVRYADHFRYCIQADSSVITQEELDFFVGQLEAQVEELLLEASQLNRRISTDASLFVREKEVVEEEDNSVAPMITSHEEPELISKYNSNNNNKLDRETPIIRTTNHPFIYKLKDSIEQIRGGIQKIKEQ